MSHSLTPGGCFHSKAELFLSCVCLQDSLQVCLSKRVPLLLARGAVRLLVVDSLAALFRCEFQATDWMERTKQMLTVASTLHRLSQEFSTPVLCINQVKLGRTPSPVGSAMMTLFIVVFWF